MEQVGECRDEPLAAMVMFVKGWAGEEEKKPEHLFSYQYIFKTFNNKIK